MYVCGSIEKFSDLREEAFQSKYEDLDLHKSRLTPSVVVVKKGLASARSRTLPVTPFTGT